MTLLAVRLIDFAIFGSLGGLWIGGAIFIVLLYRWVLRFERGEDPADAAGDEPVGDPVPVKDPVTDVVGPERARPRVAVPQTAAARRGLQAAASEA